MFDLNRQIEVQTPNYPISHYQSHSRQRSNFDAIGYNSMNGFYNQTNQVETNDNFLNFQAQQMDLLPPPQP